MQGRAGRHNVPSLLERLIGGSRAPGPGRRLPPMHTSVRTLMLSVEPLRMSDQESDQPEPEVMLPAQLGWGSRVDSETSGVRALLLAMLEDAIRCLLTPGGSRRVAAEAESWIRGDEPDWPLSYRNVCEALGFQPDLLRRAILRRAAPASDTTEAPWTLHLRRGRGPAGMTATARRAC